MNARLLLSALVLFTASALTTRAEDDPIAEQLLKDKEAIVSAQGKAKEEVLEEMKEFLAKSPGASAAVAAQVVRCGVSDKVWGLSGSGDVGTKVVTADYARGDQTQLWRVIPAGDGWAYIENVKTGLVIECN